MKKYGMIIDYKYCTGCHSCEVTCRKEKDIALDEWGIKIVEMGPVTLQGEWMWNYIPIPSDLCDLCIDRLEVGKKPLCEVHCLAACLEIVPINTLSDSMASKGDGVTCFIP